MEKAKWNLGQRFTDINAEWECVASSVTPDNFNGRKYYFHFYALKYVLKSGKLSKATKTICGEIGNMKVSYSGRF